MITTLLTCEQSETTILLNLLRSRLLHKNKLTSGFRTGVLECASTIIVPTAMNLTAIYLTSVHQTVV